MRIMIAGKMAIVALFGLPAQPADTLEVVAIDPSRADSYRCSASALAMMR
jgi:hypothetical protein